MGIVGQRLQECYTGCEAGTWVDLAQIRVQRRYWEKTSLFWNVEPFSLVDTDRCFREGLMIRAVRLSETSVNIYQKTRCNISEGIFISVKCHQQKLKESHASLSRVSRTPVLGRILPSFGLTARPIIQALYICQQRAGQKFHTMGQNLLEKVAPFLGYKYKKASQCTNKNFNYKCKNLDFQV